MGNEEADEILIITLRQVGCDLPEECKTAEELGTELLVRSVSHCLHVIGDQDLPEYSKASLPREMSSRFRACTTLADAIKKLGFKDEISFHQFLYPTPKYTRELFAFILERLPHQGMSSDQQGGAVAGGGLMRGAISALAAAKATRSLPSSSRPQSLQGVLERSEQWSYPCVRVQTSPLLLPPSAQSNTSRIPLVLDQVQGPHALAPSVFEANAAAVERSKEVDLEGGSAEEARAKKVAWEKMVKEAFRVTGSKKGGGEKSQSLLDILDDWAGKKDGLSSRFARAAAFGQDREDGLVALDAELTREERLKLAEEERVARMQREEEEREEEAAAAQAKLDKVGRRAEALLADTQTQIQSQRQLEHLLDTEAEKTEEVMGEYKVKKRTLQMLVDRDDNMAALKLQAAEAAKALVALAAEWETHRAPLVEELRQKKGELVRRQEDMKWKVDKVKEMRAEMKDLADKVRVKDELAKSLLEELNAMPKSAQRSSYTRRVVELVRNMEKQRKDIDSILADTQQIQKEIQTSSDTLNRSYGATDDMVYRDAKNKGDAASKKMYKLLVATHECFAELSKTIEDTGTVLGEVRELELKTEQESVRSGALNLDQVLKDLKDIKEENAALAAKAKP
mmetsp:Transcript_33604/g.80136  ORF Transcript_33604/g.80136 Transcript_33604/m.80136 type:complete len:625 (+) Transcript_33604:95-1969(+)|eukprot:CAMPEP_0177704164 /NCGR_PEP_ID=MMETSP0484_2-20121128/8050_1 /TAXON_ID=354590 /ORGANISM="Rhodomonas lens, Strain RHODO" /LENGTH=624 /DNA_ID=CAMNT_0019215549 /DNA_START=90 /DNA_END=1964 /DNA_ORIENTATION=-